jgi:hypothetical protein
MPDWIFWMFAGWFIFAVVGRRHRSYGGSCGARHRLHRQATAHSAELPTSPRKRSAPEAPPATPRLLSRNEVEAQLRARYVSGEISVENYEDELDQLYRQR